MEKGTLIVALSVLSVLSGCDMNKDIKTGNLPAIQTVHTPVAIKPKSTPVPTPAPTPSPTPVKFVNGQPLGPYAKAVVREIKEVVSLKDAAITSVAQELSKAKVSIASIKPIATPKPTPNKTVSKLMKKTPVTKDMNSVKLTGKNTTKVTDHKNIWIKNDYKYAANEANRRGTNVLVLIGFEGCAPCQLLKSDLKNVDLTKLVCLYIDIETCDDETRRFCASFNSYPTLGIVTPDGKLKAYMVGYDKDSKSRLMQMLSEN